MAVPYSYFYFCILLVEIPEGFYVLVNSSMAIPRFNTLTIKGVLEFVSGFDYLLEVNQIIIKCGQLIAGWENEPFLSRLDIILGRNRTYQSSDFLEKKVGQKGIGVFGHLQLHGKPHNVHWTYLNETAKNGSSEIRLVRSVDWQVGDEIVISTTSFDAEQTEVVRILGVSDDSMTLTLNASLRYMHVAFGESFEEVGMEPKAYEVRAAVGLLSRNIRIIGRESGADVSELFGARVLVWNFVDKEGHVTTSYKGYVRLRNVEMRRPGQYNQDADNLKYGILFANQNDWGYSTQHSYVRDCSFHLGLGTAIGVIKYPRELFLLGPDIGFGFIEK